MSKYGLCSRSLSLYLLVLLLLLGGDIEVNPGPHISNGLSLVHMNIQSLYMSSITGNPRVKLDEVVSTYAVDREVDFICMSETWLHNQTNTDKILIPNYREPYRRDRNDRQGGGVCAYVSENIVSRRLDDLEPPDIDLIWIELTLQAKRVIVGVGYRPPHQPVL